jgi:hypothetical protein
MLDRGRLLVRRHQNLSATLYVRTASVRYALSSSSKWRQISKLLRFLFHLIKAIYKPQKKIHRYIRHLSCCKLVKIKGENIENVGLERRDARE